MILVIVMVVVTIIALAGFSFVAFMLTENKGVHLRGDELQAQALASSGEEYLQAFLEQPAETRDEAGGSIDNPELFRAVPVVVNEQTENNGRFSIVTEFMEEEGTPGLRFGSENESARLNLAAILPWDRVHPGSARRALMALPGMTAAVADALLDWIDADSNERENGAEADYYAGLEPAYAPRNGLPESLDELLLVKGVSRELLFGRSPETLLESDAAEDSLSTSRFSTLPADEQVAWASLLTLHSAERNVNALGEPRVDLNAKDISKLHQQLVETFDERVARFVVLYRQHGPYAGGEPGIDASTVEFNPGTAAQFPIVSPLDLAGVRVAVPNASGAPPTVVASPFAAERDAMRQYLPKLLDETTVDAAPVIAGRINVNEASPAVLLAVPGFDRALVEQIVAARKNRVAGDKAARRQPTWLLTDGLVDLAKMRLLLPYVTCGGDVHRAQIVGFFDQAGPAARMEYIIDATVRPARSVYWKDLRALGRGPALDEIGVEQPAGETSPHNGRTSGQRRAVLTQARSISN
jgi:type II secretory pathway component PulK